MTGLIASQFLTQTTLFFLFFNWLLSEWLCECPWSHLRSGQHGSGFLRYPAKQLFKEDVDLFFPPAWLWAQMKHLHFNLHNVFSFR